MAADPPGQADPANPFFAKALVNRYWAHFFGRGIVDPLDDMRVTNPPSNPELLDALAKHLDGAENQADYMDYDTALAFFRAIVEALPAPVARGGLAALETPVPGRVSFAEAGLFAVVVFPFKTSHCFPLIRLVRS